MSQATNLRLIKLETSLVSCSIIFTITVRFNNLAGNLTQKFSLFLDENSS
jgi:hypothetical protein